MISFIVPAYNEETELPSTLGAIRAATSGLSQPVEIIVVDDASTDATPEIAEQAGARVVSIHRRQIGAARNAGDFWRSICRCIIHHDDFDRLRQTRSCSANRAERRGKLCLFVVRGNNK